MINWIFQKDLESFNIEKGKQEERIALVDLNNRNPIYPDSYLIRKFVDGKWKVVISLASGRINKEKLIKDQEIGNNTFQNDWRVKKVNL